METGRSLHASSAARLWHGLRSIKGRKGLRKQSYCGLKVDPLEERQLLAVLGPQLQAIIPDNGPDLLAGQSRLEAPRELTLRFSSGQVIDPATLGGIQITRGGEDQLLGTGDDVPVRPGFVGIGNFPNEVVLRFRETLPEDLYRITIVGDNAQAPLRNTAGLPFNFDTFTSNGSNQSVVMTLDLGPRVVAVVPQPVSRDLAGVLSQRTDQIEVYFDHRDQLDLALATNPALYQLIFTDDTATTADDVIRNPDAVLNPVTYDPATGKVVLTFNTPIGQGTYRLRIGDNLVGSATPFTTPVVVTGGLDQADTFGTSALVGTLTGPSRIFYNQVIDSIHPLLPLNLPGANNEPGHRQILAESHFLAGPTAATGNLVTGVETEFYHFPASLTNSIPQTFPNVITETQKQRVREIYEFYGHYLGIKFVESTISGTAVGVGDLRAADPTVTSGPGGVAGLGGPGLVWMDSAENWGVSEGLGSFFRVTMHEIGHSLRMGHAYELPDITVQGTAFGNGAERVFPGDHDLIHNAHLHPQEANDIDLYQFNVATAGQFSAETFAERLTTSSLLDTVLTLYGDVPVLTANAGNAITDGHTFTLSDGATTATLEFEQVNSMGVGNGVTLGNFAIVYRSNDTSAQVAASIARTISLLAGLDVEATVEFNRVFLRGSTTPTVALTPSPSPSLPACGVRSSPATTTTTAKTRSWTCGCGRAPTGWRSPARGTRHSIR